MEKPLLICLTPVRNEAWCLRAFLTAASSWADVIIIADQSSDDGSRQIASTFPKVKLIDNPFLQMHQSKTRELLFEEANKIPGSKLIFTLDADEFLSGDFKQTLGWEKIMNSNVGDVFVFRWLNLCGSFDKAEFCSSFMEWGCHYGERVDGIYPNAFIHELRLPLPSKGNWVTIDDIYFIHFAGLNVKRQLIKHIFYQFSHLYNEPKKSAISFHRSYYKNQENAICQQIDDVVFKYYLDLGIDLKQLVENTDFGKYYMQEISRMIEEKSARYFSKIDCWNKLIELGNVENDPRSLIYKVLHRYLKSTVKYKHLLLVRVFDKILKQFL